MKIDIEDVLYWMDAIRNSEDRYRTLESFWKGQVHSKIWLIDNLTKVVNLNDRASITIYGGWNGVLASLLFNSSLEIDYITSVDIDPTCETIATTINKLYEIAGKFSAITADMCEHKTSTNIVINTSCEHITLEQFRTWLSHMPKYATIVLQSNDYFVCKEHVNCVSSLDQFKDQAALSTILFASEIQFPLYKRFMIIGKK
jgi:hypothetical protein